MANDVTLNASSGTFNAASDEISGRHHQLIKVEFGVEDSATMVSPANPLPVTEDTGTLVQRAEEIVLLLSRLLSGGGGQVPDTAGRTRVSVDAFNATTIGTVTTVGTVTRLAQLGVYDAGLIATSQSNTAALALRDRISVS